MQCNAPRLNPTPLALLFTAAITGLSVDLSANPAQAATYRLFNQAANQLPKAQGWLVQVPIGAIQALESGSVVLNTRSNISLQSGYARSPSFSNLPMSLDQNRGYTFSIDLTLLAESHQSQDRAGFSTILIGRDFQGIELGFWASQVWAQNDGINRFKKAEGGSINTTKLVHYDVVVQPNRYCVFVDRNYTKPLLKGPLRNYSSFGWPYNMQNFVFIGDNTQSASATVKVGNIDLQDSAIKPCPAP